MHESDHLSEAVQVNVRVSMVSGRLARVRVQGRVRGSSGEYAELESTYLSISDCTGTQTSVSKCVNLRVDVAEWM